MKARQLNLAVQAGAERAATLEPKLVRQYEGALGRAGKRAAAAFTTSVTDPDAVVAAASWTPPQLAQVLDEATLADSARKKTQATQRSMLTQQVGGVLAQAGISWTVRHPLSQQLLDGLASRADGIGEGLREPVAQAILVGQREGLSVPDTARLIQSKVDGVKGWQATQLARNDLIGISNGGGLMTARMLKAKDAKSAGFKQWFTAMDGLVRPTHAAAGGQTVPLDQPFNVGSSLLQYPGDPSGAHADVINCFPAETLVEMPGLRASTQRWYEGDLVRLRLSTGDTLAGTPNHPVLRADGQWVPLGELAEGDDLVCARLSGDGVGAPDPERPPAMIGEIHRLASRARVPKRVALAPPDLHGNGEHGEVDVVAVDGSLLIDVKSASEQQVMEFGFALADRARALRSGRERTLTVNSDRLLQGAAAGRVGCRGEDLPLLERELLHTNQVRFRTGSRLQAQLSEPIVDDCAGDTHFAGHAEHAFPLAVSTTQIVEVNREPFKGHVYTLDTGAGWFTANTIVSRNCRCTQLFVDTPGVNVSEAVAKGETAQQILGDHVDTESLFANPDGTGYVASRRALHEQIVASTLKNAARAEKPRSVFLAGGSGAGKSTIKVPGLPARAAKIDPDEMKKAIPEYRRMVDAGDEYAATAVHEESSTLAKQALHEANELGSNVIIDGTGNAGPGKFAAKIRRQQELGNDVEVILVDIPIEEALKRAAARAAKTGRVVADDVVTDIHQNVASAFKDWRHMTDWQVWSNDDAAVLIARRLNGVETVYNQGRFEQMLAKATR